MRLSRIFIVFLISSILIFGCGDDDSDVAPVISPQGDSDDGTPTDGDTITGDDGVPMTLIPAGEFQMGDALNEGSESELPVHTVYVDAFYMDVYEVTNAQYGKFMNATGHEAPVYWNHPDFNAADHPVVGVSWYDAAAYAEWAGKRLPTEAEWEKAARGGLVGKRYPWYPWGDEEPDGTQCNFADKNTDFDWSDMKVDDGYQDAAPVGSFVPNGYGLYDMAGNVLEWCADWNDGNYYSISPQRNPTGPNSGTDRIMRGGSWYNKTYYLRVSFRSYYWPTRASHLVGFRCVARD